MMKIQLIYAPAPREVVETELTIAELCTVREALDCSGWLVRFPEIEAQRLVLSIWGRATEPLAKLRDGDRLEVCRALRVDPKVARRERFVGQGVRGAGLFSQRRAGSKAGY